MLLRTERKVRGMKAGVQEAVSLSGSKGSGVWILT